MHLFARKGFVATGLRELAAEADLTPAALYHYMDSKDDLLVEIMRSTIEPLHDAATATLATLNEPEQRLVSLVELHVWMHGSRPLATLVTDTELRALDQSRRAVVVEFRDAYEALWRETLRAGVAVERFDIADVRLTAIGLLELCTGVSHWYKPRGDRHLNELCQLHAEWALRMVDARRGRRPVRRKDLKLTPPLERMEEAGVELPDLP